MEVSLFIEIIEGNNEKIVFHNEANMQKKLPQKVNNPLPSNNNRKETK